MALSISSRIRPNAPLSAGGPGDRDHLSMSIRVAQSRVASGAVHTVIDADFDPLLVGGLARSQDFDFSAAGSGKTRRRVSCGGS